MPERHVVYPYLYEYQSHWFGEHDASKGFLAAKAHAEGEKGWRVVSVTPCRRYDPDSPVAQAAGDPIVGGLLLLMERAEKDVAYDD